MAGNPLVSIITPVFNGIKYLEICIRSVLNQSYPHIEHIFVDGGSTDGTLEVLASYQAKHPDRLRIISEPDRGPEEAWNKGLEMANGEVLGWLGADDFYEPDAIQTVAEFFQANPDAYFVFGGYRLIDETGKIIRTPVMKDFNLKEAINRKCDIPAHSAFYRREVIEKVGLINTSTRISELDYWIRVGKNFQIHRMDKTLSNFRVHEESFSGSIEAAKMYALDGFRISRRYGGSIFSPRGRRYLIYRFGVVVWALSILKPICPRFIWNSIKKLVINE
ncbi:glycosyltransferase family 2 protein [Chloroflexota bacterium]